MTDDARVSALLKDLLDRSPTTAPDRLLTLVLRDVRVAPQRRQPPLLQGWRRLVTSRSMRPIAVGAIVVAVIGVVAVGQIVLRPATSGPGTTSSPPSSPSAPPSPSPIPSSTPAARLGEWYRPMSPGRYVMPEPNTDGVGKWPVGQVVVTVPVGWTQWGPWRGGGIVRGTNNDDATARLTFGRLGSLHPRPKPCFTALRQPGPTVDDLASGLQAVADVEVTGFAIGSYVGKRVKFAIPDPSPECRGLHGWSTPDGGEQWSYAWDPGWYHLLHILDVDGVRFVIDASYRLDASPGIGAEMEAIVGSIELHSSPVVAAEPPSGITWSQSSLGQDWPAPVRPEPVGGAADVEIVKRASGDGQYVDVSGDIGVGVPESIDIRDVRISGYDGNGYNRPSDPGSIDLTMFVDLAAPIRTPIADPRESWIAYGFVVDTNGDGAPDVRFGIDNMPKAMVPGDYPGAPDHPIYPHRAWCTDLHTGRTLASEGAYGCQGKVYFDTWYPGEDCPGCSERGPLGGVARFGVSRHPDEPEFRFYAWASVIEDGRVVGTDYAPDTGWLDPWPVAKP